VGGNDRSAPQFNSFVGLILIRHDRFYLDHYIDYLLTLPTAVAYFFPLHCRWILHVSRPTHWARQ